MDKYNMNIEELINEVNNHYVYIDFETLCGKYQFSLVEASIFSIIFYWNFKQGKSCTYSQLKFCSILNTSRTTLRKSFNNLVDRGILERIEKKSPKGIIYEFRIKGFKNVCG